MRNSLLIIWREYRTRVAKRSFLLMSIIGPMIMAGITILMFWLSLEESENQKLLVVDSLHPLFRQMEDTKNIDYEVQDISLEQAIALMEVSDFTGVLFLPKNVINSKTADLYFKKQPSLNAQRSIERTLERYVEIRKLPDFNISKSDYAKLKTPFAITTFRVDQDGSKSETTIIQALAGLGFAILIYLFIFMYSVQVMRGVIEEKVNRIVEVIISTVRPIQLMWGKIIGVGAVGLTQILIWIVLTTTIVSIGEATIIGDRYNPEAIAEKMQMTQQAKSELSETNKLDQVTVNTEDSLISKLEMVNFGVMLPFFLFYFLGGYFLYSAMMAAIGSIVDSETDTQQFVLPVTFPLILAYMCAFLVFDNPSSDLAVWMSIIPFTSPVMMMVRIPFGIDQADMWQVYTSMILLLVTFVAMTWLAGRIYRTGILMYGKKPSAREIFKWLKHS